MTLRTRLERIAERAAALAQRAWNSARAHPWRTAMLLPAAMLAYVLVLIPFTPSIGDIKKAKLEHPTVVMAMDGRELATYKRANRDWVKLADMSPNLVDALISTEDKRFFDHHGMDFKRTATALLNTLAGDRQGGSTITQQLARNLYPDEVGRAPTITRKIKEAITALKIEAVYTKQEILETYLNTVPFLYNAYGVEMAARTYFDKPASKLDVVESATLVGMLKGTSYYNPVLNPERSLERRNTVLAMMVKNGKLEQPRFEQLRKRALGLDFEKLPEVAGPMPHLARELRQWLGEWADQHGYNIFADGLVVRTSIDSRLQDFANAAVQKQTARLQGRADARRNALRGNKALVQGFVRDTPAYRSLREQGRTDEEALRQLVADAEFMKNLWQDKTRLEAGFMAVEPGSGYVRAWVGSRDFQQDQFDHVNQAHRQPGSTFKPFVYGAAFEQGISPMTAFLDGPVEVRIDERTVWRPKDVDAPSGQMLTLRDGLVQSKNSITAQLVQRVGVDSVAALARALGVRSKLDLVPSLALGTSPVTLKEMVAAYGGIANQGAYLEPTVVLRIEDRHGAVLQDFAPSPPQHAMSQGAAQTLIDVMRGVVDQGTGVRIRTEYKIPGDVAGKTGTTQNDTDGWFILMHPQLVAGAWVGFNDARVTMLHEWGQGAHSALPIVGDFFLGAIRVKAVDTKAEFAAPRNKGAQDPSLMGRVGDWFGTLFGNGSTPATASSDVVVTQPVPLPEMPQEPRSYEPEPRRPDASVATPEVYTQNQLPAPPTATLPPAGTAVGGGSIQPQPQLQPQPRPPLAGTAPPPAPITAPMRPALPASSGTITSAAPSLSSNAANANASATTPAPTPGTGTPRRITLRPNASNTITLGAGATAAPAPAPAPAQEQEAPAALPSTGSPDAGSASAPAASDGTQ